MELREGLGYAGFVVDGDRAVGAKGGYLQGHDHAVVVAGGIRAAFEEIGGEEALREAVAFDDHFIAFDVA